MATLQFHGYNKPAYAHNRRDFNVISKENEKGVTEIYNEGEMRPDGRIAHYEAWEDTPLEKAYDNIFGGAIKAYNASQKRQDRKIDNYLEKVNKNKQLNASYEVILGIYENKNEKIDEKTKEKILKKYVDTFDERNPNFVKIGAFLHDDENGKLHVHLDYVPVAHYDKGLALRNSQTKALKEMGIETDKSIPHDTLMNAWQRREREYIRDLALEYDIDIEKTKGGKPHLEKNAYKEAQQEQQIRENEAKISQQNEIIRQQEQTIIQNEQIETELDKLNTEYYEVRKKITQTEEEYVEKENKIAELEVKMAELSEQIAEKEDMWAKMEEIEYQVAEYENVQRELAKKDMFGKEKDYVKLSRNQAAALYAVGKRQEKWDDEVAQKERTLANKENQANIWYEKFEKDKKSLKRDKEQFDDRVKSVAYGINQKFEMACRRYGDKAVYKFIETLTEPIRPEQNRDEYSR